MFANAIAGEFKDGIIPPAVPAARSALVMDDAQPLREPMARSENADSLQAPPPRSTAVQQTARDDEQARIRMLKMQLLEEATKARTSVQVPPLQSRGPADLGSLGGSVPVTRDATLARLATVREQIHSAAEGDATAAYKARMDQLRGAGLLEPSPSQLTPTASASALGGDVAQLAGSGNQGSDRWKLDSKPEAPRTPYELRAGFVIPAILISGINSALPGPIMAQVAQNVYDTATGNYKLIPQGSRLVGAYSNEIAYGQARVLIAWQRIIFPDGKAMDIGAMPGADAAGYAGFTDQVNNHYFRLFGSALLMSGVVAGIALSQGNQNVNAFSAPTASSAMSAALGQQLGQVTAQLIAKNLNIAPTLEIRPGYRFNVIVVKDMTFSKPYRAFDY
jgi:type IV secretion system protein VirB10